MTRAFVRVAQAACIVYDIGSAASFSSIPQWLNVVLQGVENQDIPVAIVGNKCDGPREVTTEDGEQATKRLAAEGNNVTFFEASAKTGIDVDEVLLYLLKSTSVTSSRGGATSRSCVDLTASTSTPQSSCFGGQKMQPFQRQEVCCGQFESYPCRFYLFLSLYHSILL